MGKLIPIGGHLDPKIDLGFSIPWKYVQKNLKKNIHSLIMNKIIPKDNPFCTTLEWRPKKVLSEITSCHHRNNTMFIKIKPINKWFDGLPINQEIIPVIKIKHDMAVIIG